nr:hypothetical protein [Tanacetum cinerariifolium]
MGNRDKNHVRTLEDYSKPSHEGYRNTIELPERNNVLPPGSDTIRLVQNGCSFHRIRFEDPNQYLKDFLKLVDSLDLNGDNRERMRMRLFQFSVRDQASNWIERRTAKLHNDILVFQQHQGESLSEAWTRFKDLLQKVPHHGIDCWLLIQIFYDRLSFHLKCEIDRAVDDKLRDKNTYESWEIIENLALHDHGGWNDSTKLTNERPAETNIRLSLASHSYIYPLEIAEDALVDVAGYVYLVDFVILDIKEDERRSFILGTPLLTTAKAAIKFDKGTITLKSGKRKISFHKILETHCMIKKGIKNDIGPIAPIMTVNRLLLEWEENIKLHQEKEIKFDQWRSKAFKNEHPAFVIAESGVTDEGEVT